MTRLRHNVAFVQLALCFAAVALWWRSYRVLDDVQAPWPIGNGISFLSFKGQLLATWTPVPVNWARRAIPADIISGGEANSLFGTGTFQVPAVYGIGTGRWVNMPYWFISLLIATVAFAIRPSPRFRFSL